MRHLIWVQFHRHSKVQPEWASEKIVIGESLIWTTLNVKHPSPITFIYDARSNGIRCIQHGVYHRAYSSIFMGTSGQKKQHKVLWKAYAAEYCMSWKITTLCLWAKKCESPPDAHLTYGFNTGKLIITYGGHWLISLCLFNSQNILSQLLLHPAFPAKNQQVASRY